MKTAQDIIAAYLAAFNRADWPGMVALLAGLGWLEPWHLMLQGLLAGLAWSGAGLMRFPSLLLDQGSFPKGLGAAAIELAIGMLLLSGAV